MTKRRPSGRSPSTVRLATVWCSLAALFGLTPAAVAQPATPPLSIPIHIVENRGQFPPAVRFAVEGTDRAVYFRRDGLTLRLGDARQQAAVAVDFVGAREVEPVGECRREAVVSYFRGSDPAKWTRAAPTFGRVAYRDLWPGIDLEYDGGAKAVKYRFCVRPGGDPARIRFRYRGLADVRVDDDGALVMQTAAGVLRDPKPVSTQGEQRVASAYRMLAQAEDEATIGFAVGAYARERTLVIDPVVFVFSGYIGGTTGAMRRVAVDPAGNLYATGSISNTGFPAKVGPFLAQQGLDAFIAKVDPSGKTLIYAGFLGGPGRDEGYSVAADTAGHAYVTGTAWPGFPLKGGGPAAGYGAFITKITPDGSGLVYSAVIGGANGAIGAGIAIDGQGAAFITGRTRSDETTFPVSIGPDLTHNGAEDGFVAKLDATGRSLSFCGYIGGFLYDDPLALGVDAFGNVFITGVTTNDEHAFPVTVGPDLTYNQSPAIWGDGFVCRVNAAGTHLDYCGYIGGDGLDQPYDIAVDAQGRAHVVGETYSTEQSFPTIVGPRLRRSGPTDAFIARVSAKGDVLEYCGFLGGAVSDRATGVALDRHGAAYVSGSTNSTEASFPVSHGPDLTFNGVTDGFVAKVRPDGTGVVFAGFIGGDGGDLVNDLALGADGALFVCGLTNSNPKTFPLLVGPDLTWNYPPSRPPTPTEGFVAKLGITLIEHDVAPRPGETVTFRLTASEDAGRRYQVGSSLAAGSIPIDTRTLGLAYDAMLALSVSGLAPGVFGDYAGTIGTGANGGRATATLTVPSTPALVGTKLHTALVTLDSQAPSGVSDISNTAVFTVR